MEACRLAGEPGSEPFSKSAGRLPAANCTPFGTFADRTPIPGMFDRPQPEIEVTQEIRQKGYEPFVTSADRLMHFTGIVQDPNGNKYYITKNSGGTDRNPHGGYLNMSESYVRAKTIFIMVHKDAVPADIKAKLKI